VREQNISKGKDELRIKISIYKPVYVEENVCNTSENCKSRKAESLFLSDIFQN
jgi:hypothetical protein